jgi:predicted acyl esterase
VPENVQLWSFGCLKAKYRQVDEALSAPGLPWHPFTEAEELLPDTIYELQIEMTPVFKTFKKGCRLWLKIACDDVLFSTWDSSSHYVETPSAAVERIVTIHSSSEYPSQLLLPIVTHSSERVEIAAPLRDALPGAERFTT